MQGTLLAAAISPDNTPHGYNLTFAFPMLMFIIIATALYLRIRSSHRVPGHVTLASTNWAEKAQESAAPAAATTTGSTLHEGAAPEPTDSAGTSPAPAEPASEATEQESPERESTEQESTEQESTEDTE